MRFVEIFTNFYVFCFLLPSLLYFISSRARLYINLKYCLRNRFWCRWKSFTTWTEDRRVVSFWLLFHRFQCYNFVCSRPWLANFFDNLNILSIVFRNDSSFFINLWFDSISSRPKIKNFPIFDEEFTFI